MIPIRQKQWFKPKETNPIRELLESLDYKYAERLNFVQEYKNKYVNPNKVCMKCKRKMKDHGMLKNGSMICEGDWVVEFPYDVTKIISNKDFIENYIEYML